MSFRHWQFIRKYLNFSQKDRSAVIVLVILIVIVLAGHVIIEKISFGSGEVDTAFENAMKRYAAYCADKEGSNHLPVDDSDSIITDEQSIVTSSDSVRHNLVTFDPNSAEKEELIESGFNDFQASNLVKYRDKGGYFSKKQDLLKIYGIDSAFFCRIVNQIRIEGKDRFSEGDQSEITFSLELNSSDSVDLIKLRGIGPVFASRILKYRDLLGGYYTVDQLREVYNLPEETFLGIKGYLKTDTSLIRKLRINFAGYSELLRHPYLEKEEVSNLLNYRQKNGAFGSKQQLLINGLVDSVKFQKIRNYISCR